MEITGKSLNELKKLLKVGDSCMVYEFKKKKPPEDHIKTTGTVSSLYEHHFCVKTYIKGTPIIKSYKYIDLLVEKPEVIVHKMVKTTCEVM